jgi:antitoxin ParD1/3/4
LRDDFLHARVARGQFAAIEAAARQLIDESIFEIDIEEDDMAWAKPPMDEPLAAVERGESIMVPEHSTRTDVGVALTKDRSSESSFHVAIVLASNHGFRKSRLPGIFAVSFRPMGCGFRKI